MTIFSIRQFKGIAPRVSPRLLADGMAQNAVNCVLSSGTLRPLRQNLAVLTLPKQGSVKTIYRYGQDIVSDSQYWFNWLADVNVVRGPVANDDLERMYFTGDGVPKMTDMSYAVSGGGTDYPVVSYPLGVPAPTAVPTCTVSGDSGGRAVSAIKILSGGSGYTSPVFAISAPQDTANGTQATATAIVSLGSISSITLGSPGAGYDSATVTIAAPGIPGGVQATASISVAQGNGGEFVERYFVFSDEE